MLRHSCVEWVSLVLWVEGLGGRRPDTHRGRRIAKEDAVRRALAIDRVEDGLAYPLVPHDFALHVEAHGEECIEPTGSDDFVGAIKRFRIVRIDAEGDIDTVRLLREDQAGFGGIDHVVDAIEQGRLPLTRERIELCTLLWGVGHHLEWA